MTIKLIRMFSFLFEGRVDGGNDFILKISTELSSTMVTMM
jgi:hypothetical protein